MKRIFRIAQVIVTMLLLVSGTAPGKDSYKIRTIVIDAGHGGHDAGCLGASSREKHIALDIALKLGKQIESSYPDIKVIYTRKTDVFIPLHERANIANKAHADLFICIHLNAGGKGAYGSETYIMGNHKTEDNLEVAKRENDAILLEEDYKKKYDGFDPNSPEANIIFSLYQSQFMSQSLLFASNIQEEFTDFAGRYNRGVKQAGFLVLYKTAMPAVLIECGFLTHEPEEKFLASEKGQQIMSGAIFRAFKEYKVDMESGTDTPVSGGSADKSGMATNSAEPAVSKPDSVSQVKTILHEGEGSPAEKANVSKEIVPDKAVEAPVKITSRVTTKPTTPAVEVDNLPEVFLGIQIGASKNPSADNKKFLSETGVTAISSDDGYTRYIIGTFKSSATARKKLNELKSGKHPDAFLTGFKGKQRISVAEAEQLLKTP